MPHVKIGYPHKAPDGTKRTQGETVYMSSAEAEGIVADGKGKIVKVSPKEAVKIAKAAADAAKPKAKVAPESDAANTDSKPLPKRPVPAKTEKPADA